MRLSQIPSNSEVDWRKIVDAAEKQPLANPLTASLTLFKFEQLPPPHIREIYGAVDRGLKPDKYPDAPRKIARIMPRDHGKSEAASHVVPVWLALKDPDKSVLIMMETETQAKKKLKQVRETVKKHADYFGRTVEKDAAFEFTLRRDVVRDEPTVMAAGVRTGVTGGHFDFIAFDDLVDWKRQRTEPRRRKVWKEFQDYLNLGTEGGTVFLVVGTRKHPDDLYSHLIQSPAWNTVQEKAIADWTVVENGEYVVVTDRGRRYGADELSEIDPEAETIAKVEPKRYCDVLWPERYGLDVLILDMLAAVTGNQGSSLVWKRENQNDAKALMGQVLDRDMLRVEDEAPGSGVKRYAGIDLGIEEDPQKAAEQDTDYWAVAVIANNPVKDKTWVEEICRRRGMTLTKAVNWVKTVLMKHDLSKVIAESNQAQRWFVHTARKNGLKVEKSSSTGDKEDRIIDLSSMFESGDIVLTEAPWNGTFIDEWVEFPTGDHDDMLDAVEIAMRNISREKVSTSGYSMGDLPV